jgi:tol-pal system protein YbgF
MHRSFKPLLLAGSVALLVGAPVARSESKATRERVDIIDSDLRDAQGHVVDLQKRADELEKQVKELRGALALDQPSQRMTPADLAARLSSVETDLRVLFENQNENTHRIAVLSDKVDAVFRQVGQMQAQFQADAQARAQASNLGPPAPSSGNAGPPNTPLASPEAASAETEDVSPRDAGATKGLQPATPGAGETLVDPEEIYQSARADFGRGSYDLAESGFQEFVDRFPDSELADNALYWVGECRYSRGEYEKSIDTFGDVARRWPQGDKTPDAGYKKGLALLALNRTAEGIVQLQKVKDGWPETPAGRLARGKLQSLGLLQ